jgi:formate hydrogenlyase transcriptional activator
MGDFGQQGLFDITRILLQQPDLAALSETLTRLVQQSALADRAAIILWNRQPSRGRYACDDAGQPVSYEDETVLANGRCDACSRGRMRCIAI